MLTPVSKEVLNHLLYAQFDQERFVTGLPNSAQPYVQIFLDLHPSGLKTCIKCDSALCLSRFSVKRTARGQLSGTCKDCQKRASRAHYEENTERIVARSHARKVTQVQFNKDLVIAHCRSRACLSCGQPGYWAFNKPHSTSRPLYELVFGGYGPDSIEAALENARVFCKSCTEQYKLEIRKINAVSMKEANYVSPVSEQLALSTSKISVVQKERSKLTKRIEQADEKLVRLSRVSLGTGATPGRMA